MSTGFHEKDLPEDELREIVREAMPRHGLEAVDFVMESLIFRKSFDEMERRLNLAGGVPPICRNTFYKKRQQILAKIKKMV